MSRDQLEIKEFVLEKLAEYDSEDEFIDIYSKIQDDESLSTDEKEKLEGILNYYCKLDLEKASSKEGISLFLEIDSMTIYADAWYQYCK